ncbi:MAG: bacillithiol biosynthesis deacetylase BshB1 [Saprospiraceae bacterium]|nr:bacillithiol biosynthesis deacetylase BshB1 [Saprospiraceae bacterium]
MKIDILAVGVHPDDVELSASGTLLRHIAQGKTVGLLDLSRGEMGTRGTAELRDREAAEAAQLMGASFRKNIGLEDGFFTYTKEALYKIMHIIREHQPDIVLANALEDRHPDHGRAAKLTADACFYAGLAKAVTVDEHGAPQSRWRPKAVYHYIQDRNLKPDFVVDITPYMEQKMALIQTFSSQFFAPQATDQFATELSTPISGVDFMEFLYAKARAYGREAGFQYAEAFNTARTPGVGSLFDLV